MYRLTATNDKRSISEVYFTARAAEIAKQIYEARGYTVTVEEQ